MHISTDKPKLYMLIGPSGAGKSTVSGKIQRTNNAVKYFSWDDLRLRWYDNENYSRAWEESCRDREFKHKADQEFISLLSSRTDIIVDNTNLTPKRRKFFLQQAKQKDYYTIAVTFDSVGLQTLLDRQLTRGDKCVPTHSVIQQFNSYVHPTTDEFDIIISSCSKLFQ